MKILKILGIVAVLGVVGIYASSDKQIEHAPAENYEKLGLQNSKPIQLTEEEAAEGTRQAVEGFQKQIELSDPDAKAAIMKAQHELQQKKAKQDIPTAN